MTIFTLLGPTAVGKSAVASMIAGPLHAEIVSVDSMQVYKGMDIGTSKPGPAEIREIPCHLLDIVDPDTDFSAAGFKEAAGTAISDIISRGKRALLVGGSGLYFRAVVDDLDFSGHMTTREERAGLELEFNHRSNRELHDYLACLDSESAGVIDARNRRRVLRAIEIARSGGRPVSERQGSWERFSSPFDLKAAGLEMDRPLLYRLIEERVDRMVEDGFMEEAGTLAASGKLKRGTTAGEAIGYKQMLEHMDGLIGFDEAVDLIKKKTRNYAKRQITWFKKDPRIKWFKIEGGANDPVEVIENSIRTASTEILEYLIS
ncbi:MAG: tRNA (adenosine(37)-N6)-dimethylallyltransferase MiaA [Actinobacteria bacterium]|nr:tRNA (adenosine(37)-N6)-dimethylallyltransferase MiaA [Actinomycetota bacterium]